MTFLGRIIDFFLRGNVTPFLIVASIAAGAVAVLVTPREEEPQIVVPMADVRVSAPGLPAAEVERQVATPLEKRLYQIDGVEHVYSVSQAGEAIITVRFYVGEDREDSLVKIYNKVFSNMDLVPPDVASWVVKPIEIDDVPIVIVTLWSDRPSKIDDFAPRRTSVNVVDGIPVPLEDVAAVIDGPAERTGYTWIGFGPAAPATAAVSFGGFFPAVHVAVAKQKGTNAVLVADRIQARVAALGKTHFPDGVHARITRNYGETANDKVNELLEALVVAMLIVIALIAYSLGWREGLIVAVAVPITFSLTLMINYWADSRSPNGLEAVVQRKVGPVFEWASGSIASATHTVVASLILARIEEVRVRAGDEVESGDMVIVLESADLRARVAQSRDAIKGARARRDLALSEKERVERRLVTTGDYRENGQVEVLSGLAEGERVVYASADPPKLLK